MKTALIPVGMHIRVYGNGSFTTSENIYFNINNPNGSTPFFFVTENEAPVDEYIDVRPIGEMTPNQFHTWKIQFFNSTGEYRVFLDGLIQGQVTVTTAQQRFQSISDVLLTQRSHQTWWKEFYIYDGIV